MTNLPTPTVRRDALSPEILATSSCSSGLLEDPWTIDQSGPTYGPGASETDEIPARAPIQGAIPAEYREASDEELHQRIEHARATLGERVVVLGHFYQRDEIVRHADFLGDSFQLARAALAQDQAEYIVFCGVHFMAETADILSTPDQAVVLPNLAAGCSMADMADVAGVEDAWAQLTEVLGELSTPDETGKMAVMPITYMNSSAALKAFVGKHGGVVCTSSNASVVLEEAFRKAHRVLFFPDQHLGRNTGKAMGVALENMPMWKPNQHLGGYGNTEQTLHDSKVLLWHGFCSVHERFTVDQVQAARAQFPDARVIAHPECTMEVVDAADESGSTDYILKAVQNAEPGSVFAIGTEITMVNRLAVQHPEHTIFCLDPVVCPCSTMYRIHPAYLAWVLEELVTGRVVNRITVPEEQATHAKLALDRMLVAAPRKTASK